MTVHPVDGKKIVQTQDDLRRRREHCSADARALSAVDITARQQVRVKYNDEVYALCTVSEVRTENADNVVRLGRPSTPRGDKGTWGGILNDFLSVEHDSDGTLKTWDTIAPKANDNAVVHRAGAETVSGKTFDASPVAPAPTASDHATTKSYVGPLTAGGTPNAASGVQGKIRLVGQLGGTASAPAVPAVRLERW